VKKPKDEPEDELRAEYRPSDFKGPGIRGKYAERYRQGVSLPTTTEVEPDALGRATTMPRIKESFIVNKKGKQVGVILDMADYRRLLDALEELECIRAYDEAKASGEQPIPLEQAIEEIERERK
jgi:hypothetical protein